MKFTKEAFKVLSQDLDDFISEIEVLLTKLKTEKVQVKRLALVEEKVHAIKAYKKNSNVFTMMSDSKKNNGL